MPKKKKKKKVRIELRKNHQTRTRQNDLTQQYDADALDPKAFDTQERISGKGALSRKRTVFTEDVSEEDASHAGVLLSVDETVCQVGRVLSAQGLNSTVQAEDGKLYQCVTRRLLKSLSTEQRHAVVTGDKVLFRLTSDEEGMIERIEPRHGILSRTSRNRRHILVTNVDQVLIVVSALDPPLKPNLVDRYLITAEQAKLKPLICINKIDLINPADLQPLIGIYSQLGYQVLLVSAETGQGVQRLRDSLADHETVISGQSGVGKSSLLNQIEPELGLRVNQVSDDSHKGKHTTTSARLYPLSIGGYVADTPGIRQFELWDVIPEEVGNFFREMRPFINQCRFPNCTHTHEADCGVKNAVADLYIDARRYESYLHLIDVEDGF